ncbi:hypothetical protein ACT7DC_10495 [Bacillus cereus]
MLQFFISAEEDLLEQILIIPQAKKDFRIVYHSTITADLTKVITDFSFLNTLDLENFIIPKQQN